ncbi:hypothetical protein AB0C96_41190 [Streptomyces sp. NPDC048506]|uniref:hypothetical protein n=1 Tax=Streptomyces sp. NPDC048506 TaxID=3155028 RepID=UPI00343B04E6
MTARSRRIAVAAACGAALLLTTTGAAQAEIPAPASSPSTGDVAALLAQMREQGIAQAGGSLADLRKQAAAAGPRTTATAMAAKSKLPKCRGTFKHAAATVVLQESMKHGIPWVVKLTAANAPQGRVNFNAKIFANKREANVYQEHPNKQWWYQFHGPLPRKFDVKGSKKDYKMQRGDDVSFLWTWRSVRDPRSGGYRVVNCEFKP